MGKRRRLLVDFFLSIFAYVCTMVCQRAFAPSGTLQINLFFAPRLSRKWVWNKHAIVWWEVRTTAGRSIHHLEHFNRVIKDTKWSLLYIIFPGNILPGIFSDLCMNYLPFCNFIKRSSISYVKRISFRHFYHSLFKFDLYQLGEVNPSAA